VQFQYQVADTQGKIERGNAEADSKEQLISKLKSQGKFPLEIKESRSISINLPKRNISAKERLSFTQQLAGLLSAKIPLERALGTLCRLHFGPKMDNVILQLRRLLQEGLSFSGTLEKFPGYFPTLYINMVRIGEAGGMLPQVMSRLAQYQEDDINFRRYLISSLTYPAFIMFASFIAIIFFVTAVIPQFQSIFKDIGMELPLITKLVLFFGNVFINFWFIPILAIGASIFWYLRENGTPDGRNRLDRIKLKLPGLGKLLEKIATQKMVQSLSLLVGSGVALLTSLTITSDLIGNEVFARALRDAEQRVRQGNTLASSLAAYPVFPILAVEMIAVGEEGGNLDFMLEQVTRTYDNEIKHDLGIFLSLAEPVIIFLLVGVIAILAIAIMLPVLNMNSQISG
jgi:type II secretory pathway component PulF